MSEIQATNPPFSRFMVVTIGQLVSNIGSGLTAFAIGIYLFQLTHSATVYATIILAAFLPALLLRPLGGVIADRVDRRVLMTLGDLGSASGVVFILYMLSMGHASLWVVYTGVIFSALFVAIQNPAYKALMSDMLDQAHYAKGSGMMQLAESSRHVIAPVIAGLLLAHHSLSTVLIIDLLTFAIGISTVLWVRKNVANKHKGRQKEAFLHEFKSGFGYIFSHKPLLILLMIISLITLFVGTLQALLGPLLLSITNEKMFGLSQTVATTGMLVSSALIGVFSKSTDKLKTLSWALLLSGMCFALIGAYPSVLWITCAGFLFFLCLPFVNTSLDVLVRQNIPNHMQGRAWSIISLLSQLGMIAALGGAGFLADHVFNPAMNQGGALAASLGTLIGIGPGRGVGLMFVMSGILLACIAPLVAMTKSIRQLDRQAAPDNHSITR